MRTLQLGTAEAEQILRRSNTRDPKHPTLAVIEELGRTVRTALIADYLADPALHREIHEALQVAKQWNSANVALHGTFELDLHTRIDYDRGLGGFHRRPTFRAFLRAPHIEALGRKHLAGSLQKPTKFGFEQVTSVTKVCRLGDERDRASADYTVHWDAAQQSVAATEVDRRVAATFCG